MERGLKGQRGTGRAMACTQWGTGRGDKTGARVELGVGLEAGTSREAGTGLGSGAGGKTVYAILVFFLF